MKMKWEAPKVLVQEFVANEYVAACYKIKCTTPKKNSYYEKLYNDTNGNGQLDSEDTLLLNYSSGFKGCGNWHKGVIRDSAPVANGFVKKTTREATYVEPVFWWNEALGADSDYHVMTPGAENYETNPNAS